MCRPKPYLSLLHVRIYKGAVPLYRMIHTLHCFRLLYTGQVQDYHDIFQFCKKTKKEKARDAWATKVRPKLNLVKADIGDVSELAQQRRAMMMMEF